MWFKGYNDDEYDGIGSRVYNYVNKRFRTFLTRTGFVFICQILRVLPILGHLKILNKFKINSNKTAAQRFGVFTQN